MVHPKSNMASLVRSLTVLCRNVAFPLQARTISTTMVNTSRYSPLYGEPLIEDNKQAERLPEDDPRKYQPIKAARIDQTSSLNADEVVRKFTRMFLKEGNSVRSRLLMDSTLEHIKYIQVERYHKAKTDEEKAKINLDAKSIVRAAVENCKPLLILQRVRRGGISYQVPIPCKPNYQRFKAMTWLISAAKDKPDTMRFYEKLAQELIDAANNEGRSIRMKQDLHRICEINRAYAHFRW